MDPPSKNVKRTLQKDSLDENSPSAKRRKDKDDSRHIAALILARGGSKGIPLKNIKILAGVPLIGWAIRAALDSGVFHSVWVSTDHDEIEKVAKAWGAKVHRRSPEVSKDSSSSLEAIQEFSRKYPDVDIICNIQATSPCLHPYHLKEAVELMTEQGCDSVFSVVRRHHFRWEEVKEEKPAYGTALEEHLKNTRREIALPIEACVMMLLQTGMQEKDLFFRAAEADKLKELKTFLDRHSSTSQLEFYSDPHTVAGALKSYLKELPEPLMTYKLYEEWIQASNCVDSDESLQVLREVCEKLPKPNKNNFRYLVKFLAGLALESDVNKISDVLAPNLLWAKKEGSHAEISVHVVSIIKLMIKNSSLIFPEDVDFNVSGMFFMPGSTDTSHPVSQGSCDSDTPCEDSNMIQPTPVKSVCFHGSKNFSGVDSDDSGFCSKDGSTDTSHPVSQGPCDSDTSREDSNMIQPTPVKSVCFHGSKNFSGDLCTKPLNLNPACRLRRQDWDGELCENGSFYFATKELIAKGLLQGGKIRYCEMHPEHSVDIDVDIDWPVAEQRVLRFGYFGKDKPEVVKLLICNVSGCLTDGQINISANGDDMVSINIRDQAGIDMLKKEGVKVILIEQNPMTKALADKISKRMDCRILLDVDDKLKKVEKLMKKDRLEWKEVAYLGNDEPDVKCLNLAGLSAVPLDAPVVALNAAKYSCHCAAGRGAVREFAEHILLLKKKAKSQMEQDRIGRD